MKIWSITDNIWVCLLACTSPGLLLHLLGCLMCHRPDSGRTSPSRSSPACSAASVACSRPPSTSTTTSLLQPVRRQGTASERSRRELAEIILIIAAAESPGYSNHIQDACEPLLIAFFSAKQSFQRSWVFWNQEPFCWSQVKMDQIKFFISSQLFGYLVLVWSASNNYQIVNWSVRWRWSIPGLSDHLFKWYPTWPNHQVLSQIPGDQVWRGGGNLWTQLELVTWWSAQLAATVTAAGRWSRGACVRALHLNFPPSLAYIWTCICFWICICIFICSGIVQIFQSICTFVKST